MAFATSNVRSDVCGSLRITVGDWSGAQADAPGTIAVTGGRVWFCSFTSQDSSGEYTSELRCTVSATGAVSTITVPNLADVTSGRFTIIHG